MFNDTSHFEFVTLPYNLWCCLKMMGQCGPYDNGSQAVKYLDGLNARTAATLLFLSLEDAPGAKVPLWIDSLLHRRKFHVNPLASKKCLAWKKT
jgi:hypothetical protein